MVYASALEGWAVTDLSSPQENMEPLFKAVLTYVPERELDNEGPLQLQICSLDYSSFVGRIGIGRITRGKVKSGQQVALVNGPNGEVKTAKINQVSIFQGLDRAVVEEAYAGNIVLINGIESIGIGQTICDSGCPEGLPLLTVDEPTLTMNFMVNTSPLEGREGKFVTSRQLRERLDRELQSNVALSLIHI